MEDLAFDPAMFGMKPDHGQQAAAGPSQDTTPSSSAGRGRGRGGNGQRSGRGSDSQRGGGRGGRGGNVARGRGGRDGGWAGRGRGAVGSGLGTGFVDAQASSNGARRGVVGGAARGGGCDDGRGAFGAKVCALTALICGSRADWLHQWPRSASAQTMLAVEASTSRQ